MLGCPLLRNRPGDQFGFTVTVLRNPTERRIRHWQVVKWSAPTTRERPAGVRHASKVFRADAIPSCHRRIARKASGERGIQKFQRTLAVEEVRIDWPPKSRRHSKQARSQVLSCVDVTHRILRASSSQGRASRNNSKQWPAPPGAVSWSRIVNSSAERGLSSSPISLLSISRSLAPASTRARPSEKSGSCPASLGQSRMSTSVVSRAARTLCRSTGSEPRLFPQQRELIFVEKTDA